MVDNRPKKNNNDVFFIHTFYQLKSLMTNRKSIPPIYHFILIKTQTLYIHRYSLTSQSVIIHLSRYKPTEKVAFS